jgi:hypothetical protein
MSLQPLLEYPEPEGTWSKSTRRKKDVLTQNVGRYLLECLKLDEGLLVVAIKESTPRLSSGNSNGGG